MKKNFAVCFAVSFAGAAFAAVADSASAPQTAQQSKMASCNAGAAAKKGDERKAFMKTCLGGAK
jgi:hypothetical protein